MEKKYDVFISYSRKDYVDEKKRIIPGNVVSRIKDALSEAGISYWFDEEGIYYGNNFIEKIVTNIEASRLFVFLSTSNANNSRWTTKEIASADEFGKRIIPVRIDKTPYNKNVLFRISDLDYIEFYTNPDKGLRDLVDTIKTHLEQFRVEEVKRQEEEKKKKEIERLKIEQANKRIQEEQQQLIANIKLECTALNNEETKVELDRNNLLLKTEKIKDQKTRESLKTHIITSSPIRQKCIEENGAILQENKHLEQTVNNTNKINKKLTSEIEEIKTQSTEQDKKLSLTNAKLKKSEEDKEKMLIKISKLQHLLEADGKELKKGNKMHFVYCGIILLLLLYVGFKSCNNTSSNYSRSTFVVNNDNDGELKDSVNATLAKISQIRPKLQEYIDGFNRNEPRGIYKLGKCFETGDFLEGNRNTNIAGLLVHKAAEKGYGDAQNTLGFYFFHGRAGFVLNYDSATTWYKKAIENGSLDAEYNLALAYDDGRYTGTKQNTKRTADALNLYKKSAEKKYAKSQIALGIYYYETKKFKEAKKMIEEGLKGDVPSYIGSKGQFYMGQLYGTGKPGVELDDKIAFSWYKKSATNGDGYLEALYYLGIYYQNGRGVEKNLSKAREWFRKAANRGHQLAKDKLSGNLL